MEPIPVAVDMVAARPVSHAPGPPSAASRAAWIGLAVAIKVVLLLGLWWYSSRFAGPLHLATGDMFSYFEPIESLLATGTYEGFQLKEGRMPGYGAVYLLLRLVFSRHAAAEVLAALQIVADGASVYLMARLGEVLFDDRRLFAPVFALGAGSMFLTSLDRRMVTESFCVLSLTAGLYLLLLGLREPGRRGWFLGAGAMLGWSVFLRPVVTPVVAIGAAAIVLGQRAGGWRAALRPLVVFCLPLALAEGAWVARNAARFGEFIPLQSSTLYASSEGEFPRDEYTRLLTAWGCDFVNWNPGSEGAWMLGTDFSRSVFPDQYPRYQEDIFPAYIYTSEYSFASLVALREVGIRSRDLSLPAAERRVASEQFRRDAQRYRAAFIREHPFRYRVQAPLRILWKFVAHSGTTLLFDRPFGALSAVAKAFKLLQVALYLVPLVAGPVGMVLAWSRPAARVVIVSTVYLTLVYPLVVRMAEFRYFATSYLFFLLFTGYLGLRGWARWRGERGGG